MTPNKRRRKYARRGIPVGEPFVNTPEEIVEPIVEEIEVEIVEEVVNNLSIEDIEEVATEFGYKVNQTVNYIAIKKGRLNVATISNDMKIVTKKSGEAVEIADKESLREALAND